MSRSKTKFRVQTKKITKFEVCKVETRNSEFLSCIPMVVKNFSAPGIKLNKIVLKSENV